MVEIYLESLLPRMESEWKKLGKKPAKKQVEVISDEELKEQHAEALKARDKFDKKTEKKEEKEDIPFPVKEFKSH